VGTFTSNTLSGTVSHSFTAVYQGDGNYTTSTSPAVTSNANQASTSTTLTVSPTPPSYGATTTLTAQVNYTNSGTFATGLVTLYEDNASIGTGQLMTNGTATFTSTTITGTQSHTFYAVYGGDQNYAQSTSTIVTTQAGNKVSTTSALSISPNPPTAGSTTTLTLTITPASTGGQAPGGTAAFYEDGALIGSSTVTGFSVTYTSTTISGTAQHSFYATYSGDANYAGSTAPSVSTNAASSGSVSTSVSLSASSTAINFGQSDTLTATITPSKTVNNAQPTGTVSFYEGSTLLGMGNVASNVATLTTSAITNAGGNAITAVYGGDANYATSPVSNTVVVVVTNTEASVTASASPTTVAASGSFTVTVNVTGIVVTSGTQPSGTILIQPAVSGQFAPQTIGLTPTSATTATAAATFTAPAAAGTYTLFVYCTGSNFQCNITPETVSITVGTTTTGGFSLAVTPVTTSYGMMATATATLTGYTSTSGAGPTGTVNFSAIGSTVPFMTEPLTTVSSTSAVASESFAVPAPGMYTVTATCYATNVNCNAATATAIFTVTKAPTTTTLTAAPTTLTSGVATLLTATVVATGITNTTSLVAPTGTVTFYDNGVSLGTSTVVSGMATFSTTFGATTTHAITAVYSGDTNYLPSTSSAVTLKAAVAVTKSTLTATPATALAGTDIYYTVDVTATSVDGTTNPGIPTGSVTFYDKFNGQTTALATVALTSTGPNTSVAQYATTGQFAGTHVVYAVFAGSTSFATSKSSNITVQLTDYAVTFAPPSTSVTSGSVATATATVTAIAGFTGTVTLGCTAPASSSATCSFQPTTINTSGTSTLYITTTANKAAMEIPQGLPPMRTLEGRAATIAFAGLLLCLLAPRKRLGTLLIALFAVAIMASATGCTVLHNNDTASGPTGTPLGTMQLTITIAGTDGITSTRHDTTYQVTVQ
jgi:hypothetical protein